MTALDTSTRINVGGKNKICMKTLKTSFELLQLTQVMTYINSGNIFLTNLKTENPIVSKIENAIKKISIRHKSDYTPFTIIETICKKLPDTWVKM